ncbi:M20/M25/M40 family metallo-hydrolase [Parachryseolinea silvisoli]|jgi:putative aminopeptidase FrvX|uniref:M20/M25/M40 family metallo-hydrolase n=1 Tax=Parachryseolinea silvisoli TaxID=2873601 RepID=UPI002265DF30|nr:M20/M25/M40 family metallo-hydrolase [Parachryseolinea silvisoli]MCD9016948.1 M20/M25/M40 family metallo-hydrolase [Parachryseolinea silvisoli]
MIQEFKLLKQLCEVHAPSGREVGMKDFLLRYIAKESKKWKVKPEVYHGEEFQDCIVLKFGKPRTAIFAHMDSIGFTVRYFNQLLPIGSPDADAGTVLVGEDSLGAIECVLEFDKDNHAFYSFGRQIDRGTELTYKVNFRDSKMYIQSAYLDDRLGIYAALKVAETLKDGVIVFTCWEEHGGGSVPYLAKFIYEQWQVRQALISDITWVSDGVAPGKGVAISMRDRNLPRRSFVDRIIGIARKRQVDFQLEVEGMGSSDGRELQVSPYPFDWCFVGAPESGPHTPDERVHKHDIRTMIELYQWLMKDL